MITGAQLAPLRDQVSGWIAAAQAAPVTIPQWMIDEGCTAIDFVDGFDDPSTISNVANANLTEAQALDPGTKWWLSWAAQPGDFSVANSVLSIHIDRSGDGGNTLNTVPLWYPDAGRDFGHPRCYEIRCRWPHSIDDDFPNDGAVAWTWSQKHHRWKIENVRTGRHIPELHATELDLVESPRLNYVQRILTSVNDWAWYGRPGTPTIEDFVGSFLMIDSPAQAWADLYLPADFDYRQWHTYGCKHETGLIKRFIDGVHIPQLNVSWTPGGLYSQLDDDTRFLVLGTGNNVVAEYDHVMVCKP